MLYRCITCLLNPFNKCITSPATGSPHPFQLVDHACDHRQPAVPKLWVFGVEPEWLEQFGIVLGAAGSEHREIALRKSVRGVLVDRVKRVHQAIAERVGVDVE